MGGDEASPSVDEQIAIPSPDIQANEDLVFEATPKLGQQFNSLDEAQAFYNAYAKLVGFGTKVKNSTTNKNGVITWRAFACCKEGKTNVSNRNKNKSGIERNRRETRCGCLARMHVSKNQKGDGWIVTRFDKIHNHDLVSPSKTHLLRSHRNVSASKRILMNEWGDANLETHAHIRLLENETGGPSSMGCTESDIYNYGASLKSKFNGIDVQTMIHSFQTEKQKNGDFFYKFEIDNEKFLTRCFWVDSDCRNSYSFFGDVVVFDTTFNTNKYGFYLASIIGVNHHHQTIVFGCGLLSDQSAESFRWLLSKFLEAMAPRAHPKVIITDQDAAIAQAVADVLPGASHHHCLWQILKKFPEKVNVSSSQYQQFLLELVNIIMRSETKNDFEQQWTQKLMLPELIGNKWLADIYEIRHKWVPTFVKHVFCAGMLSSQHAVSAHEFFKKYVNKKCSMSQCVTRITRAIVQQRHQELIADHRDRNEAPRRNSNYLMEKQMANTYTKAIFLKFQKELDECALYTCHMMSSSTDARVYEVKRCDQASTSTSMVMTRKLTYDISSDFVSCSCQKFEFMGIPCRHMLIWMRLEQVLVLPERYILHRWTKNAKSNPLYQPVINLFSGQKLSSRRVTLRQSTLEVVDLASLTEAGSSYFAGVLKTAMDHLSQMDDGNGGADTKQPLTMSSQSLQTSIRDSERAKVNGAGKCLKHPLEKAKHCRKCKKSSQNAQSCEPLQLEGSSTTEDVYWPQISDRQFDINVPEFGGVMDDYFL